MRFGHAFNMSAYNSALVTEITVRRYALSALPHNADVSRHPHMSADTPTAREFAALAYALALARGQLASIEMGDFNKAEVSRILKGTAAANTAAALGLKESDLAVDWAEHLSRDEMDKIAGRR